MAASESATMMAGGAGTASVVRRPASTSTNASTEGRFPIWEGRRLPETGPVGCYDGVAIGESSRHLAPHRSAVHPSVEHKRGGTRPARSGPDRYRRLAFPRGTNAKPSAVHGPWPILGSPGDLPEVKRRSAL